MRFLPSCYARAFETGGISGVITAERYFVTAITSHCDFGYVGGKIAVEKHEPARGISRGIAGNDSHPRFSDHRRKG